MKIIIKYFKTLSGIFQHLIAIIITSLFILSLIPGYYDNFYVWLLLLIVLQMIFSVSHLRIVNLFLETIFLVLGVLGIIPFVGWLFRFIAIPFTLLDLASFNEGIIFQKVDIFTKNSVKQRYSNFKEKRRSKKKSKKIKNDKVIDVDYKEK